MNSLSEKNKLFDCACFNIRKSARLLTQKYDEALHPLGLRSTQFSILALISHFDTITVTELAYHLVMDRTTLSRSLQPLEKQGLVQTVQGEDRRTRMISLSKAGFTKLKKAVPLWKKAQKKFVKYMGDERFDHLLSELNFIDRLL